MTGTAYLVAVLICLGIYIVVRYPKFRIFLTQLMSDRSYGFSIFDSANRLDSRRAVDLIAEAVRFERIDDSVEFTHYIAFRVPEDLYQIWSSRMDKVGSAVVKRVNVLGQRYAKRARAQWRDLMPEELHYVMSEGEFLVETSFYKQRSTSTGSSFGEHGEAAFQSGADFPKRTRVYGNDPGRWDPKLNPADTRTVRLNLELLHDSAVLGRGVINAGNSQVSIGRGHDNTIVVPDHAAFEGVSTHHLLVERNESGLTITDASTNGTFRRDGARLERGRPTEIAVPSELFLAHPGSSVVLTISRVS